MFYLGVGHKCYLLEITLRTSSFSLSIKGKIEYAVDITLNIFLYKYIIMLKNIHFA